VDPHEFEITVTEDAGFLRVILSGTAICVRLHRALERVLDEAKSKNNWHLLIDMTAVPPPISTVDKYETGVTTQDPLRQRAIVIPAKAERVARFHESTLKALAELLGAAGLERPHDAHRGLIMHRRPPHEGRSFAEIYPELDSGSLLTGRAEASYMHAWLLARADSLAPSD